MVAGVPDFIAKKKIAPGAWAPSCVVPRSTRPVSRKGHLTFAVSTSSLTEHAQITNRIYSEAARYKPANPLISILR